MKPPVQSTSLPGTHSATIWTSPATCEDREFGSKRTGTRGEVVDRYRLRYEVFGEITGIRNGCSEGLLGHGQRVLNPASAIL